MSMHKKYEPTRADHDQRSPDHVTFSGLTVIRNFSAKRPMGRGWASMTILNLQDSQVVEARCAEVGPAGVRAAEAARRVSYSPVQWYFPVGGLASAGLLGYRSCWWDGTEIWAEVESVVMACGVRT